MTEWPSWHKHPWHPSMNSTSWDVLAWTYPSLTTFVLSDRRVGWWRRKFKW